MCIAQCGVIAKVEDGRFTKVTPDSEHPNGGICIKGSAAPEIVYSPDRLTNTTVGASLRRLSNNES
jgi:anaerobic selenocysteine-containing dehydrogenase